MDRRSVRSVHRCAANRGTQGEAGGVLPLPGGRTSMQRVLIAAPVLVLGLSVGALAHAVQPALSQVTQRTPASVPRVPTPPSPLSARAAARSVRVDDSGHLHLLKAIGPTLLEEGPVSGTLPGQARVRLVIGPSVTASFSIRLQGGTIYGRGGATLHSSGRYTSFGGWLTVSHGTGRYAHAHGSGRLYGVIDRHTDALQVQTTGRLSY